MTRFYVSDIVEDQDGNALQGAKVYLFAFNSGTKHTEPTIPTGTVVTGSFYAADSGGSPLTNPLTTDSHGRWSAFFTVQQRIDAVISDNNHLAVKARTGVTSPFEQYVLPYDMTSPAVGGGTTTIAMQDSAGSSLGSIDTIKVIAADIDVSSSTAIWNALGQATDYCMVQEPSGNWAMKRKDANQHLFEAADGAAVITAAAEALRVAGIGGSIATAGFPTCTSAIRIDGDGIHIWGAGTAKEGDLLPGGLTYSGAALGATPFVSIYGASCGVHNLHMNAANLADKGFWVVPQPTTHPQSDGTSGSDSNAGNRCQWDNSTILNGRKYSLYWEGADGMLAGGQVRMDTGGGGGTEGISCLYVSGGNPNLTGPLHVHGSGKGVGGRCATFTSQMTKVNGTHFEAGNSGDNDWLVEYQTAKITFGGGVIFGHMESGGLLYGSGTGDCVCTGVVFAPQALGANNTYNAIRVDASSKLELVGNQFFIGGAENNWQYAISKATNAKVIAIGNDLKGVNAVPWDNAPTSHIGNTYNDVMVPGNASSVGGTQVTLADAATVAVNAASGDYQTLSTAASRAFGAPTNPVTGNRLTLQVTNTSGGNITPTYNAVYKLVGGAGQTIATTKVQSITFRYNGTNWMEVHRTSGDI